MMQTQVDLFERYLQAIRKHLPWGRQDDILAELSVPEEVEELKRREATATLAEAEVVSAVQAASKHRC